ncbi:SdpI family protein [Amycolatopsis sp. Hca4]|uniref:SdpI family protein n=1 Tax=unclassified Amycolatopsis TaxID=2618356 RepID=UPI001591647D|nr:SdpI family protein [Amycolatopsis sp. Hca4]QKV77130.1 SdpI family protein [Amycolatopsis sp. Hca4]
MFAIALVPVVLGLLVGFGGFLGFRERLTREGGTGVRTEAALRSEEAFKLANRVASLPTMAGGAIAVLTGLAGLAMPTTGGLISAALAGVLALVLLVMGGGVLGNRAALTVPAPAPAAPAGCSGCACGAGGCGVFKKDEA